MNAIDKLDKLACIYANLYNYKKLIGATEHTETSGSTGAALGVILGTLSPTLVIGTVVILCALIGGVLLVKRKGY
jgi:hypothetical protein